MRALQRIGDAEDGGELAYADAVFDGQCSVGRVIQLGAGVAVVARDEGDDGDIETVESEDLGVQDDVFRVLVVGARADVGADLVEYGRDLE